MDIDSRLRGRRVLVTGGAGFIGSNLIESLLEEGNYVVCLDNFSTGKRRNIEKFLDNPEFILIEGDIRDVSICREAVKGTDIVFHQAALGSVPRSIADPISSTDVNTGGFVKMIFTAKEAGVERFIYASSSSVYGNNTVLPKVEDKIGKPLSPYGVTKLSDELFAEVFSTIYGIKVIGLRYFNVFGPRQDPEGAYAAVIPKFILQLMQHERPVINGDGTISRDFTFIDNVIKANHLAAIVEKEEAFNQVYNIACGESTSLTRIFEIIRECLGRYDKDILGIEPLYGPERPGDIKHSLASIKKAEELIGYSPMTDVFEGLEKTVEWFVNNR
ncbi:MAG TPA: SDR family oxidoreductase [Bacteroidales bacterium]|nr:SDR family oxidoreductase [Bacteroidales bacterium]HCI58550.1 LPS biosynthesis protein WbpP [Bacteroidota bacterium]HOU95398.1 SDR family oxidoreductase [Bacteroidales bacterium]HQG36323.1 SDR family oxidoreductase [Bacteroidales bacterium]HQG52493.1 SDR family oxidoreductase [Bacteroidales bacterium]